MKNIKFKSFLGVLLFIASFSLAYSPELGTITGRDFFDYLRRLGISEKEVMESKGKHWLSVGEGYSNFTSEAAKRGVESESIDANVTNPHSPSRSKIGLAENMPYPNDNFDRVIAVWLMDLFFNEKRISTPEKGKQALMEMLRVTKVGGDIRISPIKEKGLLEAIEELRTKGMVQVELLPYHQGHFKAEGKKRVFDITPIPNAEPGSIRLVKIKP